MSSKFILHGGNAQHVNADNDKFFAEILKDTKNEVKILLVEFAGREEKENLNFEIDQSQFMRVVNAKDLSFELATKENFITQIMKADIVYLGGGTTVRLMDKLKEYRGLIKALKGKIVAGESAGANSLCEYCYSKSAGGILKGLGLIPIKIVPHYKNGSEINFEGVIEPIETLLLSEYKYKVFEIN